MRLSRIVIMVGVLFGLLSPSLPAHAFSDDPWVFEGGGWGHGIGLSQFGALGQAQEGKTDDEILAFYYTGSSVASMDTDHWTRKDNGLWVGLVSDTNTVDLAAVGGPLTICQPAPGCEQVNQTINPGEFWKFEVKTLDPLTCRFRHVGVDNTGPHPCVATVSGLSPSARLELNGTEYARGTIRFDATASGFHAVATLKLEEYLYGLAEVPSSWPSEALKAQAIIGRSFAVATAVERGGTDGSGKLSSCGCHLRSTTADQAYAGWSKEDPAPGNFGAEWKAAVDNTDASIITHPDSNYAMKIAKAFYSSSNGGASENNEDVWGGTALPWLRSVVDPWSADPSINPLATWTVSISDEDMAEALGWDRVLDAVIQKGPPGLIVEFTGMNNGATVATELNGWDLVGMLKDHGFGYFAPGSPINKAVRVSPYISAVIDPPGFDDIVGNIFEADIEWLLAEGITKGCNPPANTLFCPGDLVSREVMAAFLNRALDLPPASEDHFTDDNSSIFEDDINRIAEAGITKGCNPPNNDRFCPKLAVDRGAMAAFLVRALGLTDGGGDDLFTDDDNSIFETDIDMLGTAGITKGCNPPDNDQFCPELPVDRGAMAAFLHRALGE